MKCEGFRKRHRQEKSTPFSVGPWPPENHPQPISVREMGSFQSALPLTAVGTPFPVFHFHQRPDFGFLLLPPSGLRPFSFFLYCRCERRFVLTLARFASVSYPPPDVLLTPRLTQHPTPFAAPLPVYRHLRPSRSLASSAPRPRKRKRFTNPFRIPFISRINIWHEKQSCWLPGGETGSGRRGR